MKKLNAAFVGSMALASAPVALGAEATKELKMAYDADPVTLDIHEQLSGGILQLSHMTFDPLLRWTKDLGFEPRLAESWERVEAFKNPKVREAIASAINQEGIAAKIMKGFATPAAQMFPAGYQGHNESLTPRFDVAKAQELMKEAGYEDGFTITMMAPNNRYVNDDKIAQAVAAMLARINIKVDLKNPAEGPVLAGV